MTNKPMDERERQLTDEAWARLESRLIAEEPSSIWAEWDRRAAEVKQAAAGSRELLLQQAEAERPQETRAGRTPLSLEAPQPGTPRKRRRKLTGRLAGAAAAALIAAVIVTPSANQALASFLNQFRMEQVVVVNEGDLESLLVSLEGGISEAVNAFGTFERATNGEYRHNLSAEEAEQLSGFTIPTLTGLSTGRYEYSIIPSQSLTLQLNVDNVNAAMKKLGATKLLPESVNGKPITLRTGVQLTMSYDEENGRYLWMSKLPVPAIEVDPSIDVQDAFETFMNFPGLPHNFRQAILNSTGLEEGRLPIPVIASGSVEERSISGVTVYIERMNKSMNAKWVKDGVIHEVGTWDFSDADFTALLTDVVSG